MKTFVGANICLLVILACLPSYATGTYLSCKTSSIQRYTQIFDMRNFVNSYDPKSKKYLYDGGKKISTRDSSQAIIKVFFNKDAKFASLDEKMGTLLIYADQIKIILNPEKKEKEGMHEKSAIISIDRKTLGFEYLYQVHMPAGPPDFNPRYYTVEGIGNCKKEFIESNLI